MSVGTPEPTSAASESWRLASMVSGTASVTPSSIEVAGVLGVAGAGDDDNLGPERAHGANQLVELGPRVHGDDDGVRIHEAAFGQELRVAAVSKVNRAALRPRLADKLGPRSVTTCEIECRSSMSDTSWPTRP